MENQTATTTASDSGSETEAVVTPTPDMTFPISLLTLEELDLEWGGYNKETLYLKGTLKNAYTISAKDVRIRVDFYKYENSQNLFDTRYVTIPGVTMNGAYTFKEELYTLNYQGKFWYTATIVSVESY